MKINIGFFIKLQVVSIALFFACINIAKTQVVYIDGRSNQNVQPIQNLGIITKVGFSTTPDDIYQQYQDYNWADPVFQSYTRFGNFLRLSVYKDLSATQKNNLIKTIDSSIAINRQIILLVPIEIKPEQLTNQLGFLHSYFLSNKIQWFELCNEPWAYYWNIGYNAWSSDTAYARLTKKYVKVIRDSININSKIIVSAWEGNAADWNNNAGNFKWTKQLLDSLYLQSPITPIDAVSFHLYSNRQNRAVSYNRLLSTGFCIDTSYITPFSFSYNKYNGLIDLLRDAIYPRNLSIFCTEYNQVPDSVNIALFRRSMGNALVFANTMFYLSKNNVSFFAFHQLGKDPNTAPDPIYSGYNCLNGMNINIPISYSIKMLSNMKDTIFKYYRDSVSGFNTFGGAWDFSYPNGGRLNDTTGSLDSNFNIPLKTAIFSRSRDTITISIVNMSNITSIFSITVDSIYNSFRISTLSSNLLTDNNDYSDNIKPNLTILPNLNSVSIPRYSVNVITAIRTATNINKLQTYVSDFSLSQNFPNPFNSETRIDFSLLTKERVIIKIYDVTGKEVENILNDNLNPGHYYIKWNANDFASGIYYYKISAGAFTKIKKMTHIK